MADDLFGDLVPSSHDPLFGDLVPKHKYGAFESAVEGAKAGVTANWNDELEGAAAASGLPENLPSYAGNLANTVYKLAKPTVGAARLGYEALAGHGSANEAYDKAVKEARERQTAMQEQHPYAYGAGEVVGGLGSMAVAPEIKGATWGARALQAAGIGAGYGAVAGAGEGTDFGSRATGAAIGAGTGALGAGLAAPAAEVASKAISQASQPVQKIINQALGRSDPQAEAAALALNSFKAGLPDVQSGKSAGLTLPEFHQMRAAGEPVMLADVGGEPTRALMRWAGNTSPEAQGVIGNALEQRFASQTERAGAPIRDLVSGGANSARTRAQLEAEYDLERGGAYQKAYEAGDRPIWNKELEQAASAPAVADALRGATNKWRDWQVVDGFGAMNPPVMVNPQTGMIDWHAGQGIPVYPNLQWWDYALRDLKAAASEASRAGNKANAKRYGDLASKVQAGLDKEVPEFADARGIASKYFGGNNIIDAAEAAVKSKELGQLQRSLAGMKPAEKEMFQEAYADKLASNIEALSDRTNAVSKLLQSPLERAKIKAVFGQDGYDKLEAFLRKENIFNLTKKAGLEGSTTARQIMYREFAKTLGLGTVGGFIGEYAKGNVGGIEGFGTGALLGTSPRLAAAAVKKIQQKGDIEIANKLASMLTSNDPAQLMQGLKIAASNPWAKRGLQAVEGRLATYLGSKTAKTSYDKLLLPKPGN